MSMPYFLNEVYRPRENKADINIVLVYIPDVIHSKEVPRIISWETFVVRVSPEPTHTIVYEYRHAINAKTPFPQLLESGASLFSELFDGQSSIIGSSEWKTPSVYLVCDLLGGIVAKEAFARTRERRHRWKASLKLIRGIICIGVPHVVLEEHRERVAPLLRLRTVNENVLPATVLSQIRRSSLGFQEVVSELGPDFMVVSAYGYLATKSVIRSWLLKASSSVPESYVRIGLQTQESTIAIEEDDLNSIWHTKTPTKFHSYALEHIKRTHRLSARVYKTPTQGNTDESLQRLYPERPAGVQILASQNSGKASPGSSFVIVTPTSSQRGDSPSNSSSFTRSSLLLTTSVSLPFLYPASYLDRPRYFTGRDDEITQIAAKLLPKAPRVVKEQSLRHLCISGLGGIGKTELAYQFANRYQDNYQVILVIKSDTSHRLIESFNKLALKLGLLSEAGKSSDEDCKEAVKAWLKKPLHMPNNITTLDRTSHEPEKDTIDWLLIFDNVEQWADLKPYWPYSGCGSVLVTTRKPDLLSYLGNSLSTDSLELSSLSEMQAGRLIKHYAGEVEDETSTTTKETRELVHRLCGLPLALIQVGAYIKDCKMSIREFCDAHPKESDLHGVYLDKDRVQDYEHNLASVWAQNSCLYPRGRLSALLCAMAFLDPEGVEEDLLKPRSESSGIPGYPHNEPDFIQQYKVLINNSMVEKVSDSKYSKFAVHRIVQKVVRAQISSDSMFSEQVISHVLKRLTSLWPYIDRIYHIGTQGNIKRWERCRELVPHVTALSEGYVELRERGCLHNPSLGLAELLYEVSLYHIEKSQVGLASQALDLSKSICAEARGSTDLSEYEVRVYRGRLGVAFVARDKDAYFDYAEKEYNFETKRSSVPSTRLAGAYLHMGIAYNFNSLWKEAEKHLIESRRIREAMHGFKKDWLFSPLYQLAHSYYHLGHYQKASDVLEEAIGDRVKALGEEDSYSVRTGALYYTLGDVRVQQGQEDQSFSLYTKAHAHFERTVGPTNPATLHSKHKMATQHVRLHSYPAARSLLDEILPRYRLVPYLRPYICRTALLYARSLQAQNMVATKFIEEAVQIFNEFSKHEKRDTETFSMEDAQSLVLYDFI